LVEPYQRPEGVSSSEEEDEVEMTLEDFQKSRQKQTKGRSSVSAEVYGLWNKKKPFTPKNIPKTADI
jgi:hypothetical protein